MHPPSQSPRSALVEGAFEKVAVDVLGPLKPSNRQNRYIVVFSDYVTRLKLSDSANFIGIAIKFKPPNQVA